MAAEPHFRELRYHPDAEQLALASTSEESLDALLPLSRLHSSVEESAAAWSNLRELGIFDITVPEEQGGSGLGSTEEALIVMALGRLGSATSKPPTSRWPALKAWNRYDCV